MGEVAMARRKNMIAVNAEGRQWDLPAGSHVWVYLRHSPGDTQTIESQVHAMQEWCAANGWIIDRMFIDEGIEGSKEQRPQFQEMMASARQVPRPVDGIVVWSFSRFARNQLDAQFYKAGLRKRGYVIVSKTDELPNNEMAPLMEAFVDWKNQRFLEDLSMDSKRGIKYIVDLGFWPTGRPPVGYTVEKVEMSVRRNGQVRYGNRVVKDDAYRDRVARAWQMKLTQNASYDEIQKETSLFSAPNKFAQFFDNLLYAGIYESHGKWYPLDWEQGARFCEPYITLDEFTQVQNGRKARSIGSVAPRVLGSRYLLSGLLWCGVCAEQGRRSHVHGESRAAGFRNYRCIQRGRLTKCPLTSVPGWRIEEAVIVAFKRDVLTPDFLKSEFERFNTMASSAGKDLQAQIVEAEREVKVQQKKVESLLDLIGKQGVSPLLEKGYESANAAWLDATKKVVMLRSRTEQTTRQRFSISDVEEFIGEILQVLDSGSEEDRRKVLARFIDHVMVYPIRAEVTFKFQLGDLTRSHVDFYDASEITYQGSNLEYETGFGPGGHATLAR